MGRPWARSAILFVQFAAEPFYKDLIYWDSLAYDSSAHTDSCHASFAEFEWDTQDMRMQWGIQGRILLRSEPYRPPEHFGN